MARVQKHVVVMLVFAAVPAVFCGLGCWLLGYGLVPAAVIGAIGGAAAYGSTLLMRSQD